MATSSISSLGLGSDGALSYDVIDQLRAVDEKAQITPIDTKITNIKTKQDDLSILTTLTASLKSATSTLSDEMSYLQRTTTVSNSAVSVTASAGSSIQDFSLHVNSLAQRDIYQSSAFALETSTFSNSVTSPAGTVVAPSVVTTEGVASSVTESSLVAFDTASMSSGDTITIGGLTLTATGTITQAEAVAAFANLTSGTTSGNSVTNGTWSGTLAGFNSGVASGTSLTFTSTTATTDVANLAVSATQKASVTETVPSDYTLSMNIDGETYDLDLTSATTLSQLKDLINDETDGKMTASILNVGGANPYKLVIKSVGTGEDNAITFSSTSNAALKNLGLDSTSLLTNGNHLQTASDANFTYNGVTISRSTNTISDLVSGLSITLNEAQESGTTTSVSVKQNLSNIKSSLESLVTKYNDLMSNLTSATKYDVDTQTAGTFQGVSQITSLSANVNRQLLGTDELGRSILDYGITLNEGGILEFDSSVFDAKILEDASDVEDFFRGSLTYSATNYTGTSVLAGSLDFSSDNFMINGVSIAFSTTGNTAAQNALALQSAINSAGLSGIEALIGDDNNVYLQSLSGSDIEITGDATKLASIGFFATNVYTQSTGREGFFSNFNTMLSSYITGDKSILTLFESTLISQKESLDKQRLSTMERLDKRYEIMATRFGAYDTIINKLNNQFKSLSMMIEQSYQ